MVSSATTNPLLSSNFYRNRVLISAPTPKTTRSSSTPFPRNLFIARSNTNTHNLPSSSQSQSQANFAAALIFSSLAATAPQALAVDAAPSPASVLEAQPIKPNPSNPSPFGENLLLTAPKPQAQPASDLPEGTQWCYSEFLNAMKKGKVERVRFSKEGLTLQLTVVDGRRASVTVVNDPDLIDILAMNGVDISVSEGAGGEVGLGGDRHAEAPGEPPRRVGGVAAPELDVVEPADPKPVRPGVGAHEPPAQGRYCELPTRRCSPIREVTVREVLAWQ